MIVILGYDGLEYNYVTDFKFPGLLQERYGKTDLSDFSQPRTVVIWSSFITGRNTEKEAVNAGLWGFKVKPEETFFAKFDKWKAIDVPGLTYKDEAHAKEREAMKLFFGGNMSIQEYDKIAFENHKENKEEFFNALNEDFDIIMGYFALADVIGHASFGNELKMRLIYKELEKIHDKTIKNVPEGSTVLIISDHGMKPVSGKYGDHSDHGFWSLNTDKDLQTPKPFEIAKLMGWM